MKIPVSETSVEHFCIEQFRLGFKIQIFSPDFRHMSETGQFKTEHLLHINNYNLIFQIVIRKMQVFVWIISLRLQNFNSTELLKILPYLFVLLSCLQYSEIRTLSLEN